MQVQSGPSAPRLSAPSSPSAARMAGPHPRQSKRKNLCLAWGPPRRSNVGGNQVSVNKQKGTQSDSSDDDSDADEDDSGEVAGWTESFLLGGTSASHAVLWEVSTGQTLARLQTPTARTRSHIDGSTVVWSCAVLPDGTTVLGDSTGRVTFYEGRTRVPIPGAAFACHGQVVPTAAAASSKSEEVKEDANRFEVRLTFRYASILLIGTVELAVVDQDSGGGGGGGGGGRGRRWTGVGCC
ncbi:hypothetical protein CF319_g5244 [Tilletia indica]|nr:hypothetical protein CF319_g5244 [Tilletia indica]